MANDLTYALDGARVVGGALELGSVPRYADHVDRAVDRLDVVVDGMDLLVEQQPGLELGADPKDRKSVV